MSADLELLLFLPAASIIFAYVYGVGRYGEVIPDVGSFLARTSVALVAQVVLTGLLPTPVAEQSSVSSLLALTLLAALLFVFSGFFDK
jgi:hypothetical protein